MLLSDFQSHNVSNMYLIYIQIYADVGMKLLPYLSDPMIIMAEVHPAPHIDKSIMEKPTNTTIVTTGTNGNSGGLDVQGPNQNHQPLQHQSSTGSMGSPEPLPSDDLSEELLQMGWRKYWSKRENMPYYFNKITNESLWEMPQIVHVSYLCYFMIFVGLTHFASAKQIA